MDGSRLDSEPAILYSYGLNSLFQRPRPLLGFLAKLYGEFAEFSWIDATFSLPHRHQGTSYIAVRPYLVRLIIQTDGASSDSILNPSHLIYSTMLAEKLKCPGL